MDSCVSKLWKADETCVEFWSCQLKSNQTLTFGQFTEYSTEMADFLNEHMPMYDNLYSIVLIVCTPHILIPAIIHGICKSNSIFLPTTSESVKKLFLLCKNFVNAVIYFCSPTKNVLPSNFVRYPLNSKSDSLFNRSDWYLFVKDSILKDHLKNVLFPVNSPNTRPAYLIKTSGSFGIKTKLVCVAHSCITANIIDFTLRFDQVQDPLKQCVLLSCALTFDPSIVQIYFGLSTHRCLVIPNLKLISDPKLLGKLCLNAHIDWLQCTPSQFMNFNESDRMKLLMCPNLNILLGGESFPLGLLNQITRYQASLFNIYGTTEVSSWSTLHCLKPKSDSLLPIKNNNCTCTAPGFGSSPLGNSMLGTKNHLTETNSIDVFELQTGRDYGGHFVIYPNTDTLSTDEYRIALNNLSSLTLWSTGDMVQYGNCGECLWFMGRKDRLHKRLGHQICLETLEHAVEKCSVLHYKIKKCRCQILMRNNKYILIAFVELLSNFRYSINRSINKRNFKLKLIKQLKYMFKPNPKPWLPDHILIETNGLPLSKHAKLVYQPYSQLSLHSKFKSQVTKLWHDSLCVSGTSLFIHRPKSYINCKFMELGGTSLMAVDFVESLINQYPLMKSKRDRLLNMIFSSSFNSILNFIIKYLDSRQCVSVRNSYICGSYDEQEISLKVRRIEHKLFSEKTKSEIKTCERGSNSINISFDYRDLKLRLAWECNFKKCVDASALIIDAKYVYIGSHSGLFGGLNLFNGNSIWPKQFLEFNERIEASACCVNYNSKCLISFGTLDNNLIIIDGETSDEVCHFNIGGAIKSPATFSSQYNLLFVGSHAKCVKALDLRSSRCVLSNPVDKTPVVAPIKLVNLMGSDYLFLGSLGGTVAMLDPRYPNRLVWSKTKLAPIFAKPVTYSIDGEQVGCVGSVSGKVFSWSLMDGVQKWQFDEFQSVNLFSNPLTLIDSNELIWASNNGIIFALDPDNGKLIWKCWSIQKESLCTLNTPSVFYINHEAYLAVTRADGLFFVSSMPSKTNTYDLELEYLVSYYMPDKCFSSPVLCPNEDLSELYVVNGCRDNKVYTFNISNKVI